VKLVHLVGFITKKNVETSFFKTDMEVYLNAFRKNYVDITMHTSEHTSPLYHLHIFYLFCMSTSTSH